MIPRKPKQLPGMIVVALAAITALYAGAVKAGTTYLDNETLYSNQDQDTETRRSDHFRICFGHYNRDTGTPMTEQLAQGNLQMFEHLWQRNIVELGLSDMGQSAILEKRDGNFYKVNFNVLMTWNDGGGGGAYMSMDGNGFSYAMANTGYCRFDPPSGATPHELGHCWEGQARGFNGTDNAGAWWECTANWFQLQLLNSYPTAGGLIWNSMYYPAHGRDYYDSWAIWEAAREDERYGPLWINNVWTNATAEQMAHEFIIDRMIRLDSSGSPDKAGALKDLWGEMAKKCVTWDYERQEWLQQANRPDDGSDWYFYQRTRTPLVQVAGTEGAYRAARGHIPMEYGFNIIPLDTAAGTTISCTFDPQCDPARQSDWRASLVAVRDNGDARYSSFWNTGTVTMKLADDESKVYVVVIATPKPMKIPDPTWAAYKSDAGVQFPYTLSFSNAAPKNVTWPAPGVSHHYHANGGGFVQDSATVDATAYVGPNAMVLDGARVLNNARIEGYAVVRNNAQVRDNAVVSGHAVVQDNAQVYGNATVRDWARVFGYAEIYENAKVIEHANCGDGDAGTHTKVFGSAVVKGTTYVYNPSTFGGSLIVDGDTANGNGAGSVADHGVHFGWSWGADAGRFANLVDNHYIYAQHAFEKDNAALAIDEYGINHGFMMNGCRVEKDTLAPARGGLVLPLDGINQYVELHNSVNDFRETAITVWAKWSGTANNQRIWSMGDGNGKEMYLTPKDSSTGKLRFEITDGTTTTTIDGAAALSGAAWTHIAVVFSGGNVTLYVDGSAVGGSVSTALRPELLNAPLMENANYLGRGPGGDYYQGYLDDFRVYSKALSSGEIAAVYSEGEPGEVTIPVDTTAPAPDAATWIVAPEAISDSAVTMSATPGTDESGWVEYYFTCTAGAGHDSGWVSFNKYTDVGLTPGTVYAYMVTMRDRAGNTTTPSAGQSATTETATAPAAAFAYGPVGIRNGQISMTAIEQTSPSGLVEYKFDRSGSSSGWQSSPSWTETGLTTGGGYTYTVTARDGRGNTSSASAGVAAEASDQAGPRLVILVAQWEMMPYATIDNKISMTARGASDASGVQYKFECVSGGGSDSGWQSSRTYVTPVMVDGTYAYRYKTRDTSAAQNTSDYSTTYSATVKPTTGYHGYEMSEIGGLPDDYLVSFTGTVMRVNAGDYYVKDISSGYSIKVRNSAYGEETNPSLALKNVLIKGHLYTFGGERQVTYATLTPAGNPLMYTISGKVSDKNGQGIAGAIVSFSDVANPAENPIVTATTDSSGNYSRGVTPGTWYAVAGASAYNTSADRIVAVSDAAIDDIDFTLVANATVSGVVTKRSDGTPIAGATVYFSRTPSASADPVFTAVTDGSGNYSKAIQNGAWYICAEAANYYTSIDKTVDMAGEDIGGIDFALKSSVRNIPRTADLLFGVVTESLPASGDAGNWSCYYPAGTELTEMGSPTVEILNGMKWVKNVYGVGHNDGFRQGTYSSPIAVNGATIITAVKPERNGLGTSWTSIVDIFYQQLVLGIKNDSGRVCVFRDRQYQMSDTEIPDGQITVLSLVVQPNGTYKVWANGEQVMNITETRALTSLVNGVNGPYANSVNVGRNDPDGWTTFNGNIGDTFVYKGALSETEREQLEDDLYNKVLVYTISASAGQGGSISPEGDVAVDYGSSQEFGITPSAGFVLADVQVDGSSIGAVTGYTFTNVTENHTISASFTAVPAVAYIWTGATDREWSTAKVNWEAGVWSNGNNAVFTSSGAGPVSIPSAVTVRQYAVFDSGAVGYTLAGATVNFEPAGTDTPYLVSAESLTVNAPLHVIYDNGSVYTIGAASNRTVAINGGISSDGALVFGADETEIAAGTETYTYGIYTIATNPIALGPASVVTVSGKSLLNLNISGNTWGETLALDGTIRLGAANALPVESELTMRPAGPGALDLNGYNQELASVKYTPVSDAAGEITSMNGAPTLTLNVSDMATTYGATATRTNAMVLSGTLALTKKGLGTLTLAGENTYSGATVVEAGTLCIDGTLPNSSGVTVMPAGMLQGSGTIAAPITVMNGALLSPGSSPGILTVSNNVSLGESSVYRADIFGYGAGTEYDQLVIAGSSGTVSLNGATLEIDLNGFNPDFNATFTIISGFSGEPGTFGSITLQNATTFQNQHKLFEVIYENDTSVSLSVVPEPAVIGLVVMAGLLAMARRKK